MTSTLIGSAAPTTGDLVAVTNPAGETLIGFVLQVVTADGHVRPRAARYVVRVGSGAGSHRTWDAGGCTYVTPGQAAQRLHAGQAVHRYTRGGWRAATVVSVGRTRATVVSPGRRPSTVPAWQLLTAG